MPFGRGSFIFIISFITFSSTVSLLARLKPKCHLVVAVPAHDGAVVHATAAGSRSHGDADRRRSEGTPGVVGAASSTCHMDMCTDGHGHVTDYRLIRLKIHQAMDLSHCRPVEL